jgi:hypothetical protein
VFAVIVSRSDERKQHCLLMSVDFAGWSVDQVVSWLRSINVTDETAELLRKNQVDGHCLRELTQEDLRDLGIVLVRETVFFPTFFPLTFCSGPVQEDLTGARFDDWDCFS